ncbi:MAG: alpha/beta hydrolase [Betaproteobacteria bacterium]|nr:alpha/beta hydrolase [Betaproteobacteria bacterium]
MNSKSLERHTIAGPAGALEIALNIPDAVRGIALIAHPLPTDGGTLDNKVVYTLAKSFFAFGFAAMRFNFRGVGRSEGAWDHGHGEIDDALRALEYAQSRLPQVADRPPALAGFSFGTYIQTRVAQQVTPAMTVLIAPAAKRFALAVAPADTLIVHGENDEVIPLADVLDWARPQHLPIVVLPDCGHFFHARLTQLQTIVSKHIAAHIKLQTIVSDQVPTHTRGEVQSNITSLRRYL